MGNQSNQGSDRQNQAPQPDSPAQRDDRTKDDNKPGKQERKLGDDPGKEGESNESLPEGSAGARDLHSDAVQGRVPPQGEEYQTEDRRGDGSAIPSNVRRENDKG